MTISDFNETDLVQLPALQPADWGDLIPRFSYFIKSDHCTPIKISEDGQVAAIGTTMRHADSVWLACIVVHPAHRNKGLGKLITQSLINQVDREKYTSIYLDATEFGYPVYKKLGFEVETHYSHFTREEGEIPSTISPRIVPFEARFRDQIFEVDRLVSGEDRRGILQDFLKSSFIYIADDQVLGFYVPDWGDAPVIAVDDVAGIELLRLRVQSQTRAVIPQENELAAQFLTEHQFTQFKFSRRMYLGSRKEWKADKVFNWISGQLG